MGQLESARSATSIFAKPFFTRQSPVTSPPYIRAPHPKTGILPEPSTIKRILGTGWVGQTKIHGHRCQLHVPAEGAKGVIAFTRQGKRHAKAMSDAMLKEVVRLFRPETGWNVVDAEWLKPEDKLFVFDYLKKEGRLLSKLAFPQRFELLPRAYISPHITTLPLLRDLKQCLDVLGSTDPHVEGLVFKSLTRIGFADTSVVRCVRRPGLR